MIRYRFKVMYKPRKVNWVKLDLGGNSTLDDVCDMILTAFSFDTDHLYLFNMDNRPYGENSYYAMPEYRQKGTKVKLDRLHLCKGQHFLFLYDFGDEWMFDVKVEEVYEEQASVKNRIIEVNGELEQYPLEDEGFEVIFDENITIRELIEGKTEDELQECARVLLSDETPDHVQQRTEQLVQIILNQPEEIENQSGNHENSSKVNQKSSNSKMNEQIDGQMSLFEFMQ